MCSKTTDIVSIAKTMSTMPTLDNKKRTVIITQGSEPVVLAIGILLLSHGFLNGRYVFLNLPLNRRQSANVRRAQSAKRENRRHEWCWRCVCWWIFSTIHTR
jgi:hypothetical protein